MSQPEATTETPITGRCYCGACSLSATQKPLTVAYCHCGDCKRWTGSPLPTFAAFPAGSVTLNPAYDGTSFIKGVRRWICRDCGSPMMATFDYILDQIYVPVGVLDKVDALVPEIHCHAQLQTSWLHLDDALPREDGSGRGTLGAAGKS